MIWDIWGAEAAKFGAIATNGAEGWLLVIIANQILIYNNDDDN